jgi:uncharacterized protein (DUF2147 family)
MRLSIGMPMIAFALGVTTALASPNAPRATMTAAGIWEKQNSSGKPEGWFRIEEHGGVYEGKIVRMFPAKPGDDPAAFRCTECEGDQKNAPVLGITFIKGMRRQGARYEDGTILDPRNGSKYKAVMELSPDGQQLTVRGFLGIELFGQSQTWRRLSDDQAGALGKQSPPAKTPPGKGGQTRPQQRD